MEPVDRLIVTQDGRELSVQEGGDRRGHAVVVHAGTPGSRILYPPHVRDAERRGIRLISYDRPGYGGSGPRPGRSIADCAADVEAIVDALEIGRFAVWGASGGGPHALACASLLHDRVVAAATLASTAPFDAQGLDWYAGAGEENIEDDKLLLSDPAAARAKLEQDRRDVLAETAADLAGSHPTLFSPVDTAALTDELSAHSARRFKVGLAPGIEGWWEDSVAMLKPWGFSVESIATDVMLWHGRHDHMVPFAHGQWLVNHLRHVEAHLSEEDGHLTLSETRVPAVHAWLLERF